MALDYRKCAQEIYDNIGGKDNIVSAAHCATRLRLVIADNSKINKDALDNVEGVKGMFENGGQLQLIIGTGTVNKVFDEFIDISGVTAASKDEAKAAAAAQQPLWKRMLKTIGDEAFMGAAAQQITLPAGARSIGSKAFADCDDLLIAVIPSSVSEIANDAFDDAALR